MTWSWGRGQAGKRKTPGACLDGESRKVRGGVGGRAMMVVRLQRFELNPAGHAVQENLATNGLHDLPACVESQRPPTMQWAVARGGPPR